MIECAKKYLNAGLSVLPAKRIDKRPAVVTWKPYQSRLAKTTEIDAWFSHPQDAVCIITGAVSGNLEMIDFDHGGELFDAWRTLVNESAPDIWAKLVVETSQSGGKHVIYRCEDPVCGNLKLAQRKINGQTKTLIETRGEGGLFLCAPTPGYTMIQGNLDTVVTVTSEQRDILLEAAWALNEWIPEQVKVPVPSAGAALRPGDDYNARGDVRTLLLSHGWTRVKGGDNEYWRRPGKMVGWSATLKDNVFYVWSTNASPFESQTPYSPFSVYAILAHRGDFSKAAAELLGHGFGQKQDAHHPEVDLSRMLRGPECDGPEILHEDPGPIPDACFSMPGFVNQVIDFCLQTAPYPNRALAFCGALALQSFLAGRKIKEPGGIRTNIYLLALASTGTGKDWPRKINTNILGAIDAANCLGNRFASGEGLQDVMQANLNMLFQTDEIDTMLRCINTSRESRYESVQDTLLTFFTSSDSAFQMRTKAGMTECSSIRNPHLSIFGTATPKNYYQALSERMMTNGFFSRMLIVDVGERALCEMAGDIETIPSAILETAEYWQEQTRPSSKHNLSWENPRPAAAPYQGQAGKLLFEFQRRSDLEYRASGSNNEVSKAVWSRAAESARKLALLYACSEDHPNPRISEEAAQWAITFVNHQIRRQIFMSSIYAAENGFHADCLKLKEKLRNEPDKEMSHSKLLKRMKMDRDSFKRIIETLVEQGDISVKESKSATFKGAVYVLCE